MFQLSQESRRGCVVGWRTWSFIRPHFLTGLGQVCIPREPYEAYCDDEHPSPSLHCSCGIYAMKEKWGVPGYQSNPIAGEIYLWGTVIEHEKGWRAQFGYPKNLVVYERKLFPFIPYLSWKYGVPVQEGKRPVSPPVIPPVIRLGGMSSPPLTDDDLLSIIQSGDQEKSRRLFAITQLNLRYNLRLRRLEKRIPFLKKELERKEKEKYGISLQQAAILMARKELKER